MSDSSVQLKIDKLKAVIKIVKENKLVGQVGVLGEKDGRKDRLSNSYIGAAHEFGVPTIRLPQRSFLRMPLEEKLNEYIKKSRFFDKKQIDQIYEDRSLNIVLLKICRIAERVIAEAFDTGGFGKWVPHSPYYKNNTGKILVDTTQLRDSISSRVK